MSTMANLKTFIPKVDQEMPDYYGMEIRFLGEREPLKLEVASHEFVDKVYEPIFEIKEGKKIFKEMKLFGVHHAPYVEIFTTDDQTIVVPMNTVKSMNFDKNWRKIVEVRNKGSVQ